MTPTKYRDQVARLSKTDTVKAAEIAENMKDPWFQAQAWSHLARYGDDPLAFSRKAAKSATKGKDDYQRSAVRAWEIAALAERKYQTRARQILKEVVELATTITAVSSRAESLSLLFQAAFKISKEDAAWVAEVLNRTCASTHWRAERAHKNAECMLNGEMLPREFFW